MGAQIFKTPTSNSHHALTFLLPVLLLIITNMQTTVATSSSSQTYKTYVKTACNSTTYPLICYKSLSSYASKIKSNPRKLCIYALSVTLTASKNASSVVSKQSKKAGLTPTQKGAINDSQLDDIKTWVSAVLTDDATCTDEFDDVKVSTAIKIAIKNSIVTAARLASNALSLIDKLS
ncbi:hypothetical protein C1H46_015745 [Malus baccata]|uniref:Pectinesterase inhibitor domain-containing protein n=1 Tax=Malus baccata TaxID=106549 RepID=A0A540MI75_MALBA|nr:hypothetical protein C1H46_015745 [Malus baccata]